LAQGFAQAGQFAATAGVMATQPGDSIWRGVSLGGWLLLEPGPSYPLFKRNKSRKDRTQARCEWDLMKIMRQNLGAKGARKALDTHRRKHITKADFERIRDCGLNAVRLPFGYWVVMGAATGEPYFGPCLEFVDKALDWAEECGLQVVLDLHGCPGGESGEAPCGRRQRPAGRWHWRQWRAKQSLEALDIIANRYSSRRCVTGITVCNEPSNTVPPTWLCQYYDKAVDRIRKAGMPASRVAVVLPLFQRPEEEFIQKWDEVTGGRHDNICFDVHCYHCFENEFHGKTLAQQLRAVEGNAEMLRKYPMVVGEWSNALGCATWATCGKMQDSEVYKLFGRLQIEAFKEASHGWFFWNWTEEPGNDEWNFQTAIRNNFLVGPAAALPDWDGETVEDPLEALLNPSPAEPIVFYGDPVSLRVFYGRYVDVEGSQVNARWPDKGPWQEFSFCHVSRAATEERREVRSDDIVRLKAKCGRYLAVVDGRLTAEKNSVGNSDEFRVHVEWDKTLRHRGIVYLRSRATSLLVDADEEEEGLFARWKDFGWWQQIAVEKMSEEPPAVSPRSGRKALVAGSAPSPLTSSDSKGGAAAEFLGRCPQKLPMASPKSSAKTSPKSRKRSIATPARAGDRLSALDAAAAAASGTMAEAASPPSGVKVVKAASPKNIKRRLVATPARAGARFALAAFASETSPPQAKVARLR